MLTYRDTSYATIEVPSGATYRVAFPPNTILMDPDTGVVLSMYLEFKNGDAYDLFLLPANQSQMWVLNVVADILGDLGIRLIGSQVHTGIAIYDTLVDAILDYAAKEAISSLKAYMSQRRGQYYDVRTGELCIVKALEQYDFDFGEGNSWLT